MFGLEHLVLLLEMSWSLIRMMQFWTWQEKSRTCGSVATNMAGNNMVQHNDCAAPQVEVRTHIFPLHSGKCELVVVLQLLPPHTQLPVCLSVWVNQRLSHFSISHLRPVYSDAHTSTYLHPLLLQTAADSDWPLLLRTPTHWCGSTHAHTSVCVCVWFYIERLVFICDPSTSEQWREDLCSLLHSSDFSSDMDQRCSPDGAIGSLKINND